MTGIDVSELQFETLPTHFSQDQHEDTAPVDERDKLSKQEMRYRIIYLKK